MTATLKRIDVAGYAAVDPPSSFGRPPDLRWIAIADLRVDPAYQREITKQGRLNVRRIAAQFDWSKFNIAIVAPAGGNTFAVVDGQHRITAAALCKVDKVPCAVIEAVRADQAAAFMAINGTVTKLSPMQIHHAAVVAGDAKACRLTELCGGTGVTILRYPKPWNDIRAGETMAVQTLHRALDRFGEDALTAALVALRPHVGQLKAPTILGATDVLAQHPDWRGETLNAAVEAMDIAGMLVGAAGAVAQAHGLSMAAAFAVTFRTALAAALGRSAAGSPVKAAKPMTVSSPRQAEPARQAAPARKADGRVPDPVTVKGVTVRFDRDTVTYQARDAVVGRMPARLAGMLARGMPLPIGHGFLKQQLWANRIPADADELLAEFVDVLAHKLPAIGLRARVIKGVGIALQIQD
ncbi:ParB N-terminal domain-containing protein [Xanthobacteraceae bacterium Astr-EGSB]|uniref:DUF6551 family protein n=1 Tax=Astrobacterium formosum TaxID=3069710 RepID=UPI0027B47298|nr:ParB N-terminal domain-containing protein [Xanthobacteraceae bacterium Astr-EGSB]